MNEINFLEQLHKKTKRDYTERIIKFNKVECAEIACNFGKDYWDGERQFGYGGYKFMEGYWKPVAEAMIKRYELNQDSKILDVGCGKGFLMYEFTKLLPGVEIVGIDISEYAVQNSKEEVKDKIQLGSAINLPFKDNAFDFVYALGCLHNLFNYELFSALQEMERVSSLHKYTMQESYRNEAERINMCNWQLTQHTFFSTREWEWFMHKAGYTGDYGFIFFEPN
jgi:SAM-dependent methyltransferase